MKTILVVIDTLRADHLGCYGYARPTSPVMDKLADQGALFENFYGQCQWTIPSFTSIFTGLYPINHKMLCTNARGEINRFPLMLSPDIPVLSDLMLNAGHVTCALDNLINFQQHYNWFARGYNYYINVTRRATGCAAVLADAVNADMLPWLDQHAHDDFFVHLHYWDPHRPHNHPEPFKGRMAGAPVEKKLSKDGAEYVAHCGKADAIGPEEMALLDAYDEEILYVDAKLGEVIELLKSKRIYDDTLLVVTSDHGEVMFEVSPYVCHHTIYEGLLRVPLIIKPPEAAAPPAQRVAALAQHVDIVPTILDFAGIEPPPVDGASLRPLMDGKAESVRERAYAVGNWLNDVRSRAIIDGRWKFIKNYVGMCPGEPQTFPLRIRDMPEAELYDLASDPEEVCNVADQCVDVAARLEKELARWIDSHVGEPLEDPVVLRW